ncbi:MAG: acetolactate synthase small subunit [Rikenellaceae bacterium]|nr:acetolactate synthase small subunit [Rikenellaceae bacterium]
MEAQEFIVTAFTENQAGVLNRITAVYLRRKINIESLKVSESSIKGISMFVISAITTEDTIKIIVKQIRKIIEVLDVAYHTPEQLITQEIALYKVSSEIFKDSGMAEKVIRNTNARIIEMNNDYVVIEKTGAREEVEQLRKELKEENFLIQFTRSGSVVLHRESIEDLLQNIAL